MAALAALAVVAYLPSTFLPFIADDYLQILLGRDYGPSSGWGKVASDVLYRSRETSLIMTYWTERLFGVHPAAYNWSSVLVHVLNTWLVFGLGMSRRIGFRVAAVAAAFFAIYEGHQEAVIWYAALPELLVFLFSLASVLAWLLWVKSDGRKWGWWLASLAAFVVAIYSKEPGVVVIPLVVLLSLAEGARRRLLLWVLPFVAIAIPYAWGIFAASATHLHLNDGTFSVHAPVLKVLWNSSVRLFWFWGLLSLIALAAWRVREHAKLVALAAAWIVITFGPYVFLTYMPRVPSRHTYFASAGLSLIVAAAFLAARERFQPRWRWAPAALALVIFAHNCGYLWIVKQRQYAERAEPTERLLQFAQSRPGPIYVHKFPYSVLIAEFAVKVALGKEVIPLEGPSHAGEKDVYCTDADEPLASAGQ